MFEFEAAHHKLHMFEFSQVNKTYRMKKSVNSVTMFKYFFVINFKSNPLQLWVCFIHIHIRLITAVKPQV